jgi:thiol-disulfide isomerase/thioredoxin
MKWILHLSFIIPSLVLAQEKGITFDHYSSWQEVLEKAQREHKLVFVDCYASWCGPCKWMDQNIYNDSLVGKTVNERFVAVKLQMDTIGSDQPDVKKMYSVAHRFGVEYHLGIYPSFLFFSPNGKPLHKAIGGKRREDFLALIEMAQDASLQYYTLMEAYRNGQLSATRLPYLSRLLKEVGEDNLAECCARDYLFNHVAKDHLPGIWNHDDLAFTQEYASAVHFGDPLFKVYYSERKSIDSILGGSGKSDGLINQIIYNDELLPLINSAFKVSADPNWRQISKRIAVRYGIKYVAGNVLRGRIDYYKKQGKWAKYSKYFVKQVESSGIRGWIPCLVNSYILNNYAYDIFQHSFNKYDLKSALMWVELSLAMNPDDPESLDTKANILYKLGRKAEGIAIERRSHNMAPGDEGIDNNYIKMTRGLPTWEETEN